MVSEDQFMNVKLLKQQGLSLRKISQLTGHSRNTIRRVLRGGQSQSFQTPTRSSKLDVFKDYLRERFEQYGLSAVRLIEEIRAQGYSGSIDVVRRFLAGLKADQQRSRKLTVRYETAPGEQAQVDWMYAGRFANATGKMLSIYAFVMVLSFSRMVFARFTTSMQLPVLIDCHRKAFEFFGGWPGRILYDNMKQVRLGVGRWNPTFMDFAEHYGFIPKTHRPYRPRTKGKVERAIAYLDGNFLRGRSFADLDELNAQGLHWCSHTANRRIHATTRRPPLELFAAEQSQLTQLTSICPYHLVESVTRRVDAESMVAFARSRYSAPPHLSGRVVAVEADAGRIRIRHGDLVVADHPAASKPGDFVTDPAHIAELWKRSVDQPPHRPPPPHWQMRFDQQVATTPLEIYTEVAA
jgi:transposase